MQLWVPAEHSLACNVTATPAYYNAKIAPYVTQHNARSLPPISHAPLQVLHRPHCSHGVPVVAGRVQRGQQHHRLLPLRFSVIHKIVARRVQLPGRVLRV